MPLAIESWPTPDSLQGEKRRVLVAHYALSGECELPDPELEMTDAGFPVRLRQAVFGVMETPVLWRDATTGHVMLNVREKREMTAVLRIWAKNIKEQGFLEAASRIVWYQTKQIEPTQRRGTHGDRHCFSKEQRRSRMSQPSNDIHLTVLETKFYMSPDLQAMALADLKEHVDDFEDTDPDEIRASSTLEAALALFLWQTQLDPETGAMVAIDGDMGLTMTTDNNTLFEDILGPHVAKGSYIAVAGGNRTRWCWYFNGEGCQVKPVELAFEPFQALAKEINEGPCPR